MRDILAIVVLSGPSTPQSKNDTKVGAKLALGRVPSSRPLSEFSSRLRAEFLPHKRRVLGKS